MSDSATVRDGEAANAAAEDDSASGEWFQTTTQLHTPPEDTSHESQRKRPRVESSGGNANTPYQMILDLPRRDRSVSTRSSHGGQRVPSSSQDLRPRQSVYNTVCVFRRET
jgi:hypothetical protein